MLVNMFVGFYVTYSRKAYTDVGLPGSFSLYPKYNRLHFEI